MSAAGWADRAYYRLRFGTTTDNPDQRIAEDVQQFATYVMNLSVGLLTSFVSLVSFLVILWGLSGPAEIPLGRWGCSAHPCLSCVGGVCFPPGLRLGLR